MAEDGDLDVLFKMSLEKVSDNYFQSTNDLRSGIRYLENNVGVSDCYINDMISEIPESGYEITSENEVVNVLLAMGTPVVRDVMGFYSSYPSFSINYIDEDNIEFFISVEGYNEITRLFKTE